MKKKKEEKRKIRPIYIEWLDHCSYPGWSNKYELELSGAMKICTVGFLIGEDKKNYKVTTSITRDGDFADPLIIIKSAVLKVRKLKVPADPLTFFK